MYNEKVQETIGRNDRSQQAAKPSAGFLFARNSGSGVQDEAEVLELGKE